MKRSGTLAAVVGLTFCWADLAAAQEAIGDFYLFERSEPESGETRNSITTLAEENYASGAGGLTFRCSEYGLEMVVTATYLGREASTPVRYAFGDEEPKAAIWTLRSTGMAAIAPPDVRDEFLDRAVTEAAVVVRVSDFQLRSHAYTFHLGGLAQALERLDCR